jgi:protein-disulfide isomerase
VREIIGRAVAAKEGGVATPTVTDRDLEDYYDRHRDLLPYAFEDAKEELRVYVEQERRDAALDAAAQKLMADGRLTIDVKKPQAPVFDLPVAGYPTRGAQQAKAVLVEFGDLTCPFCRLAAEPLEALAAAHADRMKFVFVPFSVHRDAASDLAAIGSLCADEQGRFFPYVRLAFARQGGPDAEPVALAKAAAVPDQAKFSACLQSPSAKERLDSAFALARELNVTATPTLYLNGFRMPFRVGTPQFESVVARELGLPEGTPLMTAKASPPSAAATR